MERRWQLLLSFRVYGLQVFRGTGGVAFSTYAGLKDPRDIRISVHGMNFGGQNYGRDHIVDNPTASRWGSAPLSPLCLPTVRTGLNSYMELA